MPPLRLVMMGTGTFAEPTFEALIHASKNVVGLFTQPDRDTGQRRGSTRQIGRGMKQIAEEHQIPVFQPDRVNTPEVIERLRGLNPDLLVVAAYGQILSRELLEVPPLGGINVHGSLLPKYRGAAPVAWAIYRGETETGITIIRVSPRLDGGEMLAKEAIPIDPEETAGELEARLAPIGARLALAVINRMEQGPVSGEPQDPDLVTRAPKLTKQHGLIDWTQPADVVCRQIRAMQPWPSAYTYWHRSNSDKPPLRVQIIRATPSANPHDSQPGTALSSDALLIAAGNHTTVEVLELQPAGKKKMSAIDFLRGHSLQPGDRFGAESTE